MIEAAVDSGAVDTVGNPSSFPGALVKETAESKAGKHRVGAGGDPIEKLGAMEIDLMTSNGNKMKMSLKAGGCQQHINCSIALE